MLQKQWQLQEAKNKFSQVVDLAEHDEPQFITKHGRESVVILSVSAYKKLLKPKTNIVKFFKHSPLSKMQLDLERRQEMPRSFDL